MTPVAFPLLLPGALLLLALAAFLFRRMEKITPAVAGVAVVLLALGLTGDAAAGGYTQLLGMPVNMQAGLVRFDLLFQLTPTAIPTLTVTLFLTAIALLLSVTAGQGRHFAYSVLLLACGYSLLLLLADAPVSPPLLAPAFLALLTALGVFALRTEELGRTLGALRSLLPPLLAFPFFILASWPIDSLAINPQDAQASAEAGRFLIIGLLLLLAPVPFHSAGPGVMEDAPPIPAALLTLLYQWLVLVTLFRLVSLYPFLTESSGLTFWLVAAGLITALWGGIAAAGSSHPGRLWGYAMLHDWGLILLMLAAPGTASWPLVLLLFGLRAISTMAAAAGLASLRAVGGSLLPDQLQGAGRAAVWSASAFILGGLGLAGFPLSAGFTGHWAALQSVAEMDWRMAAAVLLASGGVVVGFVRQIRILYHPQSRGHFPREGTAPVLVALAAILLTSAAAIAPQLLDGAIAWALTAFRG